MDGHDYVGITVPPIEIIVYIYCAQKCVLVLDKLTLFIENSVKAISTIEFFM